MPDYSQAIIYKLCCNDLAVADIYIGSTCNFRKRKCDHKSACERGVDYPVYNFICNHGGFSNWQMVQVEAYPCTCKRELEARERYQIEQLRPTLNKYIPTRTGAEWYMDNREVKLQYKRRYDEANREAINQYHKQYKEANRELINQKQNAKNAAARLNKSLDRIVAEVIAENDF